MGHCCPPPPPAQVWHSFDPTMQDVARCVNPTFPDGCPAGAPAEQPKSPERGHLECPCVSWREGAGQAELSTEGVPASIFLPASHFLTPYFWPWRVQKCSKKWAKMSKKGRPGASFGSKLIII